VVGGRSFHSVYDICTLLSMPSCMSQLWQAALHSYHTSSRSLVSGRSPCLLDRGFVGPPCPVEQLRQIMESGRKEFTHCKRHSTVSQQEGHVRQSPALDLHPPCKASYAYHSLGSAISFCWSSRQSPRRAPLRGRGDSTAPARPQIGYTRLLVKRGGIVHELQMVGKGRRSSSALTENGERPFPRCVWGRAGGQVQLQLY